MAPFEIYAVCYGGPLYSSGAFVLWNAYWDVRMERAYYVWIIKNNRYTVMVDTGFDPDNPEYQQKPGYTPITTMLERMGIRAEKLDYGILTHLHYDHAGGTDFFPNAQFYVQESEYRFWTEDPIVEKEVFRQVSDRVAVERVKRLREEGRLTLVRGDREILPGITCLLAPGHTVGLQAVAVETAKGTAILGSDCAHLFQNYAEDRPSCLITDLPAWLASYDKLRAHASDPALLFPGHDSLMTKNYPETAEGITRLA